MADLASPIALVGQAPPQAAGRDERLSVTIALAALVATAVLLRLVPVLFFPSLTWADEIFQTTEQAHRLVYGTGLVPWEFQLGVRSWLLPGVIAGIMWLARAIGDGPDIYLPAILTVFATLAAAPVVCCFLWCRRLYGLAGGIVAAAVVAASPDLVHLGARALTEVVATHILIVGLYVIEPATRRRLVAAGALLGLAFVLRLQLAPAIALIVGWTLWRSRGRGLVALCLGGGAVVALVALFDWITLGAPLASLWRYLIVNIYYGVSSWNGVRAWDFYAMFESNLWQLALVVPLALGLLGARRMPLLMIAAALIVLSHTMIEHKEYRFLYPAFVLTMISAGIGLAQLVAWGEEALARRAVRAEPLCATVAIVLWALLAYRVWTGPGFIILRHAAHDSLAATSFVEHAPGVCGVGVDYGIGDGKDWIGAGYTYLHRPVPRYWPKDAAEMAADAPAFNWLITVNPAPAERLGFSRVQCFGEVCVAQRAGGCAVKPMQPLPVPTPLR